MAGDFPVNTFTAGNTLGASDLNSLATALNGLVPQSGTYANQIVLKDATYTRPVPFAIAAGSTTSPANSIAAGGSLKMYSVTFDTGRFTHPPLVTCTVASAPAGTTYLVARSVNATTTGVDIYVYNIGTATATWSSTLEVDWIAIQMTSATSANGWS